MIQWIILLAISLTYSGAVCAQGVATIRGQVTGRTTGKVYLYASGLLRQGAQVIDSVSLTNSFFSFSRTLPEPGGYILSVENAPGQFYFVWDKDVVAFLHADNLNESTLEESPINEALKSFSDTVETVYTTQAQEVRQMITQALQRQDTSQIRQLYGRYFQMAVQHRDAVDAYIRMHRQSWVCLFAIVYYHRDLGRRTTRELLDSLPDLLQKSTLCAQLRTTIGDTSYPMIP